MATFTFLLNRFWKCKLFEVLLLFQRFFFLILATTVADVEVQLSDLLLNLPALILKSLAIGQPPLNQISAQEIGRSKTNI